MLTQNSTKLLECELNFLTTISWFQARFVGGVDTAKSPPPAAAANEKTIQGIFDKVGGMINEELIKKVQAVYTFKVKGKWTFSFRTNITEIGEYKTKDHNIASGWIILMH